MENTEMKKNHRPPAYFLSDWNDTGCLFSHRRTETAAVYDPPPRKKEIEAALLLDLKRVLFESYMCERVLF